MSIGKRLLESTADIAATVAAREAEAKDRPRLGERNAPGQLAGARAELLSMQGEISSLREKLKEFEGSHPAQRLDPNTVRPSRWANRHASSFGSGAFARLKEDIQRAGGNTQPILVRRTDDPEKPYEIVFGHRRHRACLELARPVLSVIVDASSMPDLDLFMAMDRENRHRDDPSAYEQGTMYQAAIEEGLFQSQRRLAEAIGVSHTWVRRAMLVAELPPAIIEAFEAPTVIQPKHAEVLHAALEQDRKSVLRRAEKLRLSPTKPVAAKVLATLLGQDAAARQARPIAANGRKLGTWKRDTQGRVVITLNAAVASDEAMAELERQLASVLSKAVET